MILYASPGACSFAPHIALHHLGLEHQLRLVKIHKNEVNSPEHLARNPVGMVPVLELEDGTFLTEVVAIFHYLADLRPEAGLVISTGAERFRFLELLSFVSTELHKSVLPLFYGKSIAPSGETGRQEMIEFFRQRLLPRWQLLSDRLADRPWFFGQQLTAVDIYVYVLMTWWEHLGNSLEQWPNLNGFYHKMADYPAVIGAVTAELRPVTA